MHVVLLLGEVAVVGVFIVLWARMCRHFFTWWAGRDRPARARGTGRLRRGAHPAPGAVPAAALPPGHQPPPGLGPLSPSERFLVRESARGVCELEQFLADQRTV